MEFWKLLRRFIPIYKWRILSYILLIILSSVFSIFSFATIIPLLQLLFGLTDLTINPLEISHICSFSTFLEFIENNALYYLQTKIIDSGHIYALFILGSFIIVTSLLSNAVSYMAYYVRIPIRTGISKQLRSEVYDAMINISISEFSKENKGDFVSRMTNDIAEVDYGIGTAMDMLIKEPIKIMVYLFTLISISILLTLEAIVLLSISCVLIAIIGFSMKRLARIGQEYRGVILSTFEESLGKLKFIKSYQLEEKLQQKFEIVNNNTMENLNKINRRYSIAWPLTDFLLSMSIAILMTIGGSFILKDSSTISPEKFIYFLMVFYSIIPPIRNITKSTYGIRKAMASVDRMNHIFFASREENDVIDDVEVNLYDEIIRYKNISFSYDSNMVLENINLTILSNKTTIIIGETGIGKTTLVNILLKLYRPIKGEVYLYGKDIEQISKNKIRALITYVSQDPILFNDTITYNIGLGDQDVLPKDIEEVSQLVGLQEYISLLPRGYDTMVGDQGMNLSNGQKQCVALARALLRNTPILILDEATNCLDKLLESHILKNIKEKYINRTLIIISHDENIQSLADEIIKL